MWSLANAKDMTEWILGHGLIFALPRLGSLGFLSPHPLFFLVSIQPLYIQYRIDAYLNAARLSARNTWADSRNLDSQRILCKEI